jgi:hypothetical protein
MNSYPSWIQRIPEMLEALALADGERIDRQSVERLFDLRKTAACQLLKRMGAESAGHSLVISRSLLMARLREAQEHPEWRWAMERQTLVHERIESLRPRRDRHTLVPVDAPLRQAIEAAGHGSLPETIQLSRGLLVIRCVDFEDLLRQLVLVAQAADTNYDDLRARIEAPPNRIPAQSVQPKPQKSAQSA